MYITSESARYRTPTNWHRKLVGKPNGKNAPSHSFSNSRDMIEFLGRANKNKDSCFDG
jgi:hypothetical protein